ncbi:DUF1800 domain-containing protein [Phormidesmis priestleyi]|uniref:DUF1800 domain-containing protein n=1 Tax=Phormidesmis priestleyi TaxID=268141 RepID=UPI00083B0628|nr:DUF1800 domain-containing protein [Phormidesmis priestleyi]
MNKKLSVSICIFFLGLGWFSPGNTATLADPKVLHVLNRLSFGTRPGDIEAVEKLGAEGYIQQQLHPESIPQPQTLTDQLSQLETLNLTPLQLFEQNSPPKLAKGQTLTAEQRKAYRRRMAHVLEQAERARLLQATESPRQLQEVMVDFWYNHFNVFSHKGVDEMLVGAYEQEAIRPYALGRFRDLLEATARHPAMLYYLDNWQNTVLNTSAKGKHNQGLNENYARELMELHTLGVDGGYTQQDVIALAKIFTGWTFRRSPQPNVDSNGFYFDAKHHDFSDKVFLGHPIKGSGMAEAEQALDILAKSPATAHHISYQLAQYFVADQPPKALVDKLSQKFLATDGNIREVLSMLFHSSEFQDSHIYGAKFKTPYQYAISALRSTGIDVQNFRPIHSFLQQLGMPPYDCLTPDGYRNTEEVWLNPDAITRRISFATTLASGRLPLSMPPTTTATVSPSPIDETRHGKLIAGLGFDGTQVATPMNPSVTRPPITPVDPVQLSNTLGNLFSSQTQQAIATSPRNLRATLILGSPEFMRR